MKITLFESSKLWNLTFVSIFLFFFVSPLCGQSVNVNLTMANLHCDQTTEAGEDEVYLITVVQTSDGRQFINRLPANAPHEDIGHWNINNKKDPRDVNHKNVVSFPLAEGNTAIVYTYVMEEDKGLPGAWVQKAGEAAVATKNPYAVAYGTIAIVIGKIASIFEVAKDTDDYIGSFAVKFQNNKGSLETNWISGERVASSRPNGSGYEFRMNGDGSSYLISFSENATMVTNAYLAVFGSKPSPQEFSSYVSSLEKQPKSYNELIKELTDYLVTSSPAKLNVIKIAFYRVFGVVPGTQDIINWDKDITTSHLRYEQLADLLVNFMLSDAGSMSLRAMITKSYLDVFGRNPNAKELNNWTVAVKQNRSQYWQLIEQHKVAKAKMR